MKNRIKQTASLLLVFLLLGGCAGFEKNRQPETQSTVCETTTAREFHSETDAALIKKTTVSQSSKESETEKTTVAVLTEKATLPKKTTTSRQNTTAQRVTSTQKQTTVGMIITTQKPATTQRVTTSQKTTVVQTTKPVTTTQKETTLPVQKEESVIIGLNKINFGCDMQSITRVLGNPSETVSENLSSGGTVKSLVYAEKYGEFCVFQLLNGKFFSFYTVSDDAIVTDGESSYSLRAGGENAFSEIEVSVYKDGKQGEKAYAFRASFGGFGYYPHELTSLDGQERLIFHTTNAVRAKNGIYALEHSEKAAECVRNHCKDMAARNYFSHNTPEGVTSSQRMRDSGIAYTSCGENLAAGYLDAFGMVDGWYNSSGHRKNLLDTQYRYVGVCMVNGNESYNVYAGQNFYA